ncbi:MAG: hypothetical protein RI959_766, partial [Pseudomonadota bacterium]
MGRFGEMGDAAAQPAQGFGDVTAINQCVQVVERAGNTAPKC